jgi:hypothetical protein
MNPSPESLKDDKVMGIIKQQVSVNTNELHLS